MKKHRNFQRKTEEYFLNDKDSGLDKIFTLLRFSNQRVINTKHVRREEIQKSPSTHNPEVIDYKKNSMVSVTSNPLI